VARLHHSDLRAPGFSRRRRGRGFTYTNAEGEPADEASVRRIRGLTIPPAWVQVWVCPSPTGHIQAVGTDAAGRRQYIYHPSWRARRDRAKFERALDLAEALPVARARVTRHLNGRGPTRNRVLAASFRLLDTGTFRIGSEQYAQDDSSVGLATLRGEHVRLDQGRMEFDYVGKGGRRQTVTVEDAQVARVLRPLLEKPTDTELLAWRAGDDWRDVKSADINDYVRMVTGGDFTAKDFRTWRGTVVAAQALAVADEAPSESARRRAVRAAMQEVAMTLGNTPTIARTSYVDPRIVDRFRAGETIDTSSAGPETAVLRLLRGRPDGA